jgi:hypothetical protein
MGKMAERLSRPADIRPGIPVMPYLRLSWKHVGVSWQGQTRKKPVPLGAVSGIRPGRGGHR